MDSISPTRLDSTLKQNTSRPVEQILKFFSIKSRTQIKQEGHDGAGSLT